MNKREPTGSDDGSIADLIAAGETLRIEFKSDRRKLSDDELVEAVVCLANTDGGQIILGVEDDGTVTGVSNLRVEPPHSLEALVFNKTDPPTSVRVHVETIEATTVYVIEVKRSEPIVATSQGKCVRRILGAHGPECIPFPPSQHASRKGDLRLLDYSAAQLEQCGTESLDTLAMARLRNQMRLNAPELAELSDADILTALGLSSWVNSEQTCLTVAALLCLGTQAAIARWLPTHEVAFQVFGADETIVVNEFRRGPLLSIIEELELRFDAINKEVELDVGLARVGIRDYPKAAFREALLNAIVHRDYARKGAIYIQIYPGRLQISNPGGFPAGVTLENLLVHEPVPRNPRLADTFLRLGLVERSGRGIDRIYSQQLRWGRPPPSYLKSTHDTVRLELAGGTPSLNFVSLALQEEAKGRPLQLDDLLVLSHLERHHKLTLVEVQRLVQSGHSVARQTVDGLVSRGLLATSRGRTSYQLGSVAHKVLGTATGFVRTKGFEPIQQAAMVEAFVDAKGGIVRSEVAELCQIDGDRAKLLLRNMVRAERLAMVGSRRTAYYVKGARFGISQS